MFSLKDLRDRFRIFVGLDKRSVFRKAILVGARNPYAIVNALYNGETPISNEKDAKYIQMKLGEIIGRKLDYDQLFDPVHGSCLFCRKTISAIRPYGHTIIADGDGNYHPENSTNSKTGSSSEELTGAEPEFANCQAGLNSWDTSRWPWFNKSSSTPLKVGEDPSFDDPVQGPIVDCYFISALSSVAWQSWPSSAITRSPLVTAISQPLVFRTPDKKDLYFAGGGKPSASTDPLGSVNNPIILSAEVPLNAALGPSGASVQDKNELWVPFYEKTFALYLESIGKIAPPFSSHDRPDICRIPCGHPGETLRALMKKDQYQTYNMNTGDSRKIVDVLAKLNGICTAAPISMKTKYPTVARTNCTGDCQSLLNSVPGYVVPACAAPTGSGVAYKDELVVASHAYSLLGLHKEGGKSYVILRNPYGQTWGFVLGMEKNRYHLANGPSLKFTTMNNYPFELYVDNALKEKCPNRGVFAMLIDDFVNYFAEFSWVYP